MATIAKNNVTGELITWDENAGEWRPMSGAEIAASETGSLQAGAVATEHQIVRGARTVEGLYHDLMGNPQAAQRVRDLAREEQERQGALNAAHPVAGFVGSTIPGLATLPIGGTAALAGATRSLLPQVIEQAGVGAFLGAMNNPDEPGFGALEGGALGVGGVAAGSVASRVVGGIRAVGATSTARMRAAAAEIAGRDAADAAAAAEARAAAAGAPVTGADLPGAAAGEGHVPGLLGDIEGGAVNPAAHAQLVADADELGIKLEPGARAQSDVMRQIDARLKSNPLTSGAFENSILKPNQKVYNNLTAEALGLKKGEELTAGALDRVADHVGQQFDRFGKLAGRVEMKGALIQKEAAQLLEEATSGSTTNPRLAQAVKGILKLQDKQGTITGERLMKERGRMVRDMRRFKDDPIAVEGLGAAVDWVDLALETSIQRKLAAAGQNKLSAGSSSEAMQAFKDARNKWQLLRLVEQNAIKPDGNVLVGQLGNNVKRALGTQWSRGRADKGPAFNKLIKALKVQANFRDIVGDSGTATRLGGAPTDFSIPGLLVGGARLAGGPAASAYINSPVAQGAVLGLLQKGPQRPGGGIVGAAIARAVGG